MSKYVTTVASTSLVLIEDTPDIVQQSVYGSVIQGTNIADDLLNTITNSYSANVVRAYQYAARDYYYGLPEGTTGRLSADIGKVKEVLEGEITLLPDEEIEMILATTSTLNGANQFGEYLRSDPNYDYDPVTGVVKAVFPPLDPNDPNSPRLDGTIGKTIVLSNTRMRAEIFTIVDIPPYVYNKRISEWVEFDIANPVYNQLIEGEKEIYYYAQYYIRKIGTTDPIGYAYEWNYWTGSNHFPTLIHDSEDLEAQYYMPVVPLRINNKSLVTPDLAKGEAYKTSKRLLDILGLSITELGDAIDDNPDVDDIDHAYVTIGVNAFSTKQVSLKYMVEFAKYLIGTGGNYIDLNSDTYKTKLTWDSVTLEVTSGTIGEVGFLKPENIRNGYAIPSYPWYVDNGWVYKIHFQEDVDVIHTYVFTNLELLNFIYDTGSAVKTTFSTYDTEDEALIIPMNISIVENKLQRLEANELYYDGLRIVFNSYERTKLKWYQTGLFKIVTMVIAVAISVITYGWGAALVGFVAGLAINMAMMLIADLAVKFFGEKVGSIVAAVAMAIAIVAAAYTGMLPDILQIVNITIGALSQSVGMFIGAELSALIEQAKEFEDYSKEQLEALEQANDSMSNKNLRDPLNVYGLVGMAPDQSISDFYYSKIELPISYGRTTIDSVSNWVDTQLKLPTL